MSQDVLQALTNFAAVTAGLFVLWSLVGGMKQQPASTRFGFALMAGVVSSIATFAVLQMV